MRTDLSLVAKAQQDILAAKDYFYTLLKQQRLPPKNNVMSKMILLQEQQPSFTDEHLIANSMLLIFSGHGRLESRISNSQWC
jgi:cytochrome P450